MNEPKSPGSLFKEEIFRISDYQRGYAWQREQLKAGEVFGSLRTPSAKSGRGTVARALRVSGDF